VNVLPSGKAMALFRLIRFFTAAREHARLDRDVLRQAGDVAPRHETYHRRIVWVSGVTGVIVAVAGTAVVFMEAGDDREGAIAYLAPLLFGAAGIILGAAAACLFAPREFLLGPIGRRWMAFIGAKSTASARFVCAVVALLLAGIALFLALAPTLQAHGILPPRRP
jgi:hypothetical protein